MSIEANTYERITIEHSNDKAKAVAEAFGEYLLKTWGIKSLSMNVDGWEYRSKADTVSENEELAGVCRRLGEAKHIEASLRSTNAGGLAWRLESCFLSLLNDDEDIKNCVEYKSTDYYNQDECVDLFSFGKNGVENVEYSSDPSIVSDIKEWICYTPEVSFEIEEESEEDVYSSVLNKLRHAAIDYFDMNEELLDAGLSEIILGGSFRFTTESIPAIVDLLQQSVDALKASPDSSCKILINAVPNGENDYDFASVRFELEDGKVKVGYCRF